jgi:hypothetical protein
VSKNFLTVAILKKVIGKIDDGTPVGVATCTLCDGEYFVTGRSANCPQCAVPLTVRFFRVKIART